MDRRGRQERAHGDPMRGVQDSMRVGAGGDEADTRRQNRSRESVAFHEFLNEQTAT